VRRVFKGLAEYIVGVLIPFFVKEQLAAAIEEGRESLG
jgi:hypothetical protein